MGGIFQTYNRFSNRAVPTSGGFGIDNASDSGRFGLKLISTVFANVVWDVISQLLLRL